MTIRLAAAALLAGASLPGAAQAHAQIEVPPLAVTERTLPNGLKVIAIRDTTTEPLDEATTAQRVAFFQGRIGRQSETSQGSRRRWHP